MGFLGDIFGSRPSVPEWTDYSLSEAQQQSIDYNLAALPGSERLALSTTSFNQQQITDLLNKMLPGWSGNVAQAQKNMASELRGEIPVDVQQAIQSSTAAQALAGGYGDSGMAAHLTAKDLGLTSLNLTQAGETSLENWSGLIDQMYAPATYNVASSFISPQQQFQDTMMNKQAHFQRDWMAAQAAAMPDPITSGLVNLGTSFLKGTTSALSSYYSAGSGSGGGGGGGYSY